MVENLDLLIPAATIEQRVTELAEQISHDYRSIENLLVVGVLNGAWIFVADLIRRMRVPLTVDFLRIASYGATTESTGVVRIRKDLDQSPVDRDVLVVEDIVDTGLTLQFLTNHLLGSGPRSLEVCSLLDKPSRRRVAIQPRYVGFRIDDLFVVGYGMDFQERYRQLPGVHVLRESQSPASSG